ncbi:hypothetical protein R2A130_1964 [Ahrensia sp. R2A130]|nr:hypothetical protein R2A130_1964 [Ahrensia sp. R2A130]
MIVVASRYQRTAVEFTLSAPPPSTLHDSIGDWLKRGGDVA